MTLFETLLVITMAIIALAVFCAYVLPVLIEMFSPETAEDIRRDQFWIDARRRGLTPQQARDELEVRSVWAMVRHAASEATIRQPERFHHHINDAINAGIMELKEAGRGDLVQHLVAMYTGSIRDVLNHEAQHFVDLMPSPVPHGFKPDPIWQARRAAALRVQR